MRAWRGHIGGPLALALTALAIAGCGDGEAPDPASLTPPDAPLFAELEIEPGGEQAQAVAALSERLTGIGDPGAAIAAELDRGFAEKDDGIVYADDIEPWIGARAGFFVRSFEATEVVDGVPDSALAIEADDPEAARDFLAEALARDSEPELERTYGGVDYWFARESGGLASGMIGDYLVVGTEAAFKVAVDASEGESLSQSDDYDQRVAALPEDRLLTVFAEPGAAIDAVMTAEHVGRDHRRRLRPLLGGPLAEPAAVALTATEETISVDLATAVAEGVSADASRLLEALPADSWLAFASPGLGPMLSRGLDQLEHGGLPGTRQLSRRLRAQAGLDPRADVFDWLGGAAMFVEGAAPPSLTAGVVAEVTDPGGPRRLLARLRELAERESGLGSSGSPEGGDYGFSLGLPGLGGGAEAAVAGRRVALVLGGTILSALEPERSLSGESEYMDAAAALGEEFDPSLYLSFPGLLEFAAANGAGDDRDYRAAVPYLERLGWLLGGMRVEDEQAVSRWTLSVAGR